MSFLNISHKGIKIALYYCSKFFNNKKTLNNKDEFDDCFVFLVVKISQYAPYNVFKLILLSYDCSKVILVSSAVERHNTAFYEFIKFVV